MYIMYNTGRNMCHRSPAASPPATSSRYLRSGQSPHLSQSSGGPELLILVCDELGVLAHEDLAVHARPDQAAVGVDVHLGDTQGYRLGELILVDPLGTLLEGPAGVVDTLHFFLGNGGGAVHDQRETGQSLLDLSHDVQAQAPVS